MPSPKTDAERVVKNPEKPLFTATTGCVWAVLPEEESLAVVRLMGTTKRYGYELVQAAITVGLDPKNRKALLASLKAIKQAAVVQKKVSRTKTSRDALGGAFKQAHDRKARKH